MITTTTISISLSPLEAVAAGVAIGAGVYVGFVATQKSVQLAEAGIDKIKAKMAAKKAEKTAEAPKPTAAKA
jgi:hypothetical protein